MSTARLTIESIGPEHIDSLLAYHQRNEKHLARWEPSRSSDFFTRSYWSTYAAAVQDDAYHGRAHRFVAMLRGSRQIIASVNVTNIVHGVFQAGVLGYSVDVAHQARGYGSEAVGAIVTWCFRNSVCTASKRTTSPTTSAAAGSCVRSASPSKAMRATISTSMVPGATTS